MTWFQTKQLRFLLIEKCQTNKSHTAHMNEITNSKARIRLSTIVTDKLFNLSSKTLHFLNQQSFSDLQTLKSIFMIAHQMFYPSLSDPNQLAERASPWYPGIASVLALGQKWRPGLQRNINIYYLYCFKKSYLINYKS